MPKKKKAFLREELPDGSRIERNYRTDEDGNPEPYGSWYWVVYDPDRRPSRKRTNLRTKDKGAALLKAAELAREYNMGSRDPWKDASPLTGVTLQEAAKRFLKRQQRTGRSDATIASDGALLERLERALPVGMLVSHIDRQHIESFIHAPKPIPKSKQGTQKKGEERSPATKARMLATLRHFMGWAVEKGLIRSDPTEGIQITKARPERRDHITPKEEEALLQAIKAAEEETGVSREWLRDWIEFGTHTGLRPSEQRKLRWSAVHLAEQRIEVGKGHAVKTANSRRTVPTQGRALEILQRRSKSTGGNDDAYVFTGADGGRINKDYLRKALQRFAEDAGIKKNVVPYSLRHAFGTRAALGGVPLYLIAKLMGTSVAMVEKHYAHYAPESGAAHLKRLFAE